ncbi:potassium channel family protein [Raineya orbicola]|uniref:TrkA-N domain n=1 Tax=Raineya orbicola TaxID=2016530 RepID=A0A2N3IHT7_9BACT|nr:potassium channel family protein [Raineya orbicola]PKQ69818.1 TrkA-N domain [Raineya orbicola]
MKIQGKLKRLLIAITVLFLSFATGVAGFMLIEDYQFFDALYMCVITTSTIGYQEVRPLSDVGRAFNIFYILTNLAIFAFVISTLTSYLFEGELQRIFKRYQIRKIIKKMKNHIIVCGYGRNGFNVCQELDRLKIPYVLIEKVESHLQNFRVDKYKQAILGDAIHEETLLEANIKEAKALIIALPNDANNVFITLTARELNPNIFIVCRSSEPSSEKKIYRAGANKVIMPEALGGIHMAQLVVKPYIVEFVDLISGLDEMKLKLDEVRLTEIKPEIKHLSIKDLQNDIDCEVNIIAFKDKEKGFILNPRSDTQLSEDKVLIILGTNEAIGRFKQKYLQ